MSASWRGRPTLDPAATMAPSSGMSGALAMMRAAWPCRPLASTAIASAGRQLPGWASLGQGSIGPGRGSLGEQAALAYRTTRGGPSRVHSGEARFRRAGSNSSSKAAGTTAVQEVQDWARQLQQAAPLALPTLAAAALSQGDHTGSRGRLQDVPGIAPLLKLAAASGSAAPLTQLVPQARAAAAGASAQDLIAFATALDAGQRQALSEELAPVLLAATSVGGNLGSTTHSSSAGATALRLPIVFDTETNGIDLKHHRVVDICMHDMVSGMEFTTLVFPGPRLPNWEVMPRAAEQLHHISERHLRERDVPPAVAASLALGLWLLQRCLAATNGQGAAPLLVAHNAPFDIRSTGMFLSLANLEYGPNWLRLCTMPLAKARGLLSGQTNLEALAKRFLQHDVPQEHRAAADVRLLLRLLPHLQLGHSQQAILDTLCRPTVPELPGVEPANKYEDKTREYLRTHFSDNLDQLLAVQAKARAAVLKAGGCDWVTTEESATSPSGMRMPPGIAPALPAKASAATAVAREVAAEVSAAAAAAAKAAVPSTAPGAPLWAPAPPLRRPGMPQRFAYRRAVLQADMAAEALALSSSAAELSDSPPRVLQGSVAAVALRAAEVAAQQAVVQVDAPPAASEAAQEKLLSMPPPLPPPIRASRVLKGSVDAVARRGAALAAKQEAAQGHLPPTAPAMPSPATSQSFPNPPFLMPPPSAAAAAQVPQVLMEPSSAVADGVKQAAVGIPESPHMTLAEVLVRRRQAKVAASAVAAMPPPLAAVGTYSAVASADVAVTGEAAAGSVALRPVGFTSAAAGKRAAAGRRAAAATAAAPGEQAEPSGAIKAATRGRKKAAVAEEAVDAASADAAGAADGPVELARATRKRRAAVADDDSAPALTAVSEVAAVKKAVGTKKAAAVSKVAAGRKKVAAVSEVAMASKATADRKTAAVGGKVAARKKAAAASMEAAGKVKAAVSKASAGKVKAAVSKAPTGKAKVAAAGSTKVSSKKTLVASTRMAAEGRTVLAKRATATTAKAKSKEAAAVLDAQEQGESTPAGAAAKTGRKTASRVRTATAADAGAELAKRVGRKKAAVVAEDVDAEQAPGSAASVDAADPGGHGGTSTSGASSSQPAKPTTLRKRKVTEDMASAEVPPPAPVKSPRTRRAAGAVGTASATPPAVPAAAVESSTPSASAPATRGRRSAASPHAAYALAPLPPPAPGVPLSVATVAPMPPPAPVSDWVPCSVELSTKTATKWFPPAQLQKLRDAGFNSLLQVLLFYPKRHVVHSSVLDPTRAVQDVAIAGTTSKIDSKQYGMKCTKLNIAITCLLPRGTSTGAPATGSGGPQGPARAAAGADSATITASFVAAGRWAMAPLMQLANKYSKGSRVLVRGTVKAVGDPDLVMAAGTSEPTAVWREFVCTNPELMNPGEFDPMLHGTVPAYPARGDLKPTDFMDKGQRRGVMSRALEVLDKHSQQAGEELDPLAPLLPAAKEVLRAAVLAPPPAAALPSSSAATSPGSSSTGAGGQAVSSAAPANRAGVAAAGAQAPTWRQALHEVHRPTGPGPLELAKKQLAATEMALLQLQLLERRRRLLARRPAGPSVPVCSCPELVQAAQAVLPFALTGGQQSALSEILSDMAAGQEPMYRLLQGDVGSGKTIIAMLAMLAAAGSGRQAVLLAPTEVLAEQHFAKLQELLSQLPPPAAGGSPLTAALLTGSTKNKKALLEDIAQGRHRLLVGTHALLFVPAFRCLGLMVIDEQHKFGLRQKEAVAKLQQAQGAEQPHFLSMSATPIPRTTALVQFGDMAISTLREALPGRKPVETRVLPDTPDSRDLVFAEVRAELDAGGRAFIVYPLREPAAVDSDDEGDGVREPKLDVRSAEQEFRTLKRTKAFGKHKAALLHGTLSRDAKAEALAAFRDGSKPVLVCTVVIEVGVDVQDASILVVEHADRFGLAQLHQLRGRVGRGSRASRCFLLSAACGGGGNSGAAAGVGAEGSGKQALERLQVLESCYNGFEIAEQDLRFRGAGQVFGSGTKQSGGLDATDLCQREIARDPGLVEAARKAASLAVEARIAEGKQGLQEGLASAAAAFKSAVRLRRLLGGEEEDEEEGGEENGDETVGLGV